MNGIIGGDFLGFNNSTFFHKIITHMYRKKWVYYRFNLGCSTSDIAQNCWVASEMED